MPAVSKHALIFRNRVLSFDQDLELIDIICRAQRKDDFLNDQEKLFKYLEDSKHLSLKTRSITLTSKKIVVNHLRKTVYSAYIKDLFEELTTYIKSLLYEAAAISKDESRARRLLGDQKITFSAAEILQYETLNDLIGKISENIIQSLENERSTKELILKVCKKIGLNVDDNIINNALPFLELRHKLVHMDGQVDTQFKKKYKMFKYDKNSYVVLNSQIAKNAKINISKLVEAIDIAAIGKGILKPNTPP